MPDRFDKSVERGGAKHWFRSPQTMTRKGKRTEQANYGNPLRIRQELVNSDDLHKRRWGLIWRNAERNCQCLISRRYLNSFRETWWQWHGRRHRRDGYPAPMHPVRYHHYWDPEVYMIPRLRWAEEGGWRLVIHALIRWLQCYNGVQIAPDELNP